MSAIASFLSNDGALSPFSSASDVISFGTDCSAVPLSDLGGTPCTSATALHTAVGWDDVTGVGTPNAAGKKGDMRLEEPRVAEGKAGALNLRVQWIDVQLPHAKSCRFAITTASGNAIEAVLEQKSYRQAYQNTSSLQTGIVPVALHDERLQILKLEMLKFARPPEVPQFLGQATVGFSGRDLACLARDVCERALRNGETIDEALWRGELRRLRPAKAEALQ